MRNIVGLLTLVTSYETADYDSRTLMAMVDVRGYLKEFEFDEDVERRDIFFGYVFEGFEE